MLTRQQATLTSQQATIAQLTRQVGELRAALAAVTGQEPGGRLGRGDRPGCPD